MENKKTRRSQDSKNKMSQSINCRKAEGFCLNVHAEKHSQKIQEVLKEKTVNKAEDLEVTLDGL